MYENRSYCFPIKRLLSFPRKRESSFGASTPHGPFKIALGSRFRGNDAGKQSCDVI
jgi:hypothetical protein